MAVHHVDLPEQVVAPGEELWVKIIDIDLQRRRISLSIKQAAEGGEVSEEYREAFGEHAYDAEGNYIGPFEYTETEFTPQPEAQAAWADFVAEPGAAEAGEAGAGPVEHAEVEAATAEAEAPTGGETAAVAPPEAAPAVAPEPAEAPAAAPESSAAAPEQPAATETPAE
jgi:small subunit ribosomal protein S1